MKRLKRYRWWLLLLIAALVSLAILCRREPSPVTLENCARIREGMTEEEVTAILGPESGFCTFVGAGPLNNRPVRCYSNFRFLSLGEATGINLYIDFQDGRNIAFHDERYI